MLLAILGSPTDDIAPVSELILWVWVITQWVKLLACKDEDWVPRTHVRPNMVTHIF